jgi:hypothetical protein
VTEYRWSNLGLVNKGLGANPVVGYEQWNVMV